MSEIDSVGRVASYRRQRVGRGHSLWRDSCLAIDSAKVSRLAPARHDCFRTVPSTSYHGTNSLCSRFNKSAPTACTVHADCADRADDIEAPIPLFSAIRGMPRPLAVCGERAMQRLPPVRGRLPDCWSCGACIDACPTGSLRFALSWGHCRHGANAREK